MMKVSKERIHNRDFFLKDTLKVAEWLLGKVLSVKYCGDILRGIINETEAYTEHDPASHSYCGVTQRNKNMFDIGGKCYVYLIYGMYYCFNISTEEKGKGCAVLIRGLIPIEGIEIMKRNRNTNDEKILTNGPGKLCQALSIDLEFNKEDIIDSERIWLEEGTSPKEILKTRRIGINRGRELEWRFVGKF